MALNERKTQEISSPFRDKS